MFRVLGIHDFDPPLETLQPILPKKRSQDQRYIFSIAAPPKDEKFSYHEDLK